MAGLVATGTPVREPRWRLVALAIRYRLALGGTESVIETIASVDIQHGVEHGVENRVESTVGVDATRGVVQVVIAYVVLHVKSTGKFLIFAIFPVSCTI